MASNKDEILRNGVPKPYVDAIDRRLLGVLVEDATVSYAELDQRAALSAPAAHERVKRLRRTGVIRRTAALLEPKEVGKALLAFVHVDTHGWGKTPELLAMSAHPEVEEIHSVAGDTAMLLKVRTADAQGLEALLSHLYSIKGVVGTRAYIVLSTYLERPVQPDLTREWPQQDDGQST